MSYLIEIAPPARSDVRQLSAYLRGQVLSLVGALAREPRPARAKRLREAPEIYRIWLACRWRIAYEVDEEEQRLIVLRVRDKDRFAFDSLTWMSESEVDYGSLGDTPVAKRDP